MDDGIVNVTTAMLKEKNHKPHKPKNFNNGLALALAEQEKINKLFITDEPAKPIAPLKVHRFESHVGEGGKVTNESSRHVVPVNKAASNILRKPSPWSYPPEDPRSASFKILHGIK